MDEGQRSIALVEEWGVPGTIVQKVRESFRPKLANHHPRRRTLQEERLRDSKSLQESHKNRAADQQGCCDAGHDQ